MNVFSFSKILKSTTALVFMAASSVPAFGMDVEVDEHSKGSVVLPVTAQLDKDSKGSAVVSGTVSVNTPKEEPKTWGGSLIAGIASTYTSVGSAATTVRTYAGSAVQKVQATVVDTGTYIASTRVGQATSYYAEETRKTIEVTGNMVAEAAKTAEEAVKPRIQQTNDFLNDIDTYRAALDDIITNGVDVYTPTKNVTTAASQQLTEAFNSSNTSSSSASSSQAIVAVENTTETDTTLSNIGQVFNNPFMHSVLEGIIEESVPRVQNLIHNLILKYGEEGGVQVAEKMGLVQRITYTAVRTANPLLAQIEDSIKAFDKHMMNGAIEGLGYSLNPALYLMQALKLAELDGIIGTKLYSVGTATTQKLIKTGVIQSVASNLDFQLQRAQLLTKSQKSLTMVHGVAAVGGLVSYPLGWTQTTKGYSSALNTAWDVDCDLDTLVNHIESTSADVQGTVSKLKDDTVLKGIVSVSIDRSLKAAVKDINDSLGNGFKGKVGQALANYVVFGTTNYQQPQTTALDSTNAVVATINGSAKQHWGGVKNWFNSNIKVPFSAGCAEVAKPLNNVVGGQLGKVASSYVAEAVADAPLKAKALQALNTLMTSSEKLSSEIQNNILGSEELFKGMGVTLTNMFFDSLDKSTKGYRQNLGLPAFSEWSKKRDELTVWQKGTRTGLWALGRVTYGAYTMAQGTIELAKNTSEALEAMSNPMYPYQF